MELIILLLLFLLIPLANYVLEQLRRRYRDAARDARRAPDMGVRRQAAPPASPASIDRQRAQETLPVMATRQSPGREIRYSLFRSRRDLRRTIIAMTILGPCRAIDPPD